jgi:hypothetical protein
MNKEKSSSENGDREKSKIFKIKSKVLDGLFEGSGKMACQGRLERLREQDGVSGLLRALGSETDSGIIGDKKDLLRRVAVFGGNTKPLPETTNIISSVK